MMIFLNEERAYRNWVTHHRLGYVLDGRRKPRISHLLLHRSDCSEVKFTPGKRHAATTGNRLKACSLDRLELEAWALETCGKPANSCTKCRPAEERTTEPVHLTRLGRDILDYVLEAAVIHMEHEHPPYHLTIGDIAACFAKTPGQLTSVLNSLAEQGLITLHAAAKHDFAAVSAKSVVFPTAAALRTLESFQGESDSLLELELAKLHAE